MSEPIEAVSGSELYWGPMEHRSPGPEPLVGRLSPAPATENSPSLPEAVATINADLADRRTHLRFRVDDDLNQVIVSVVDERTGEVVRQLPAEEVLRIARGVATGQAHVMDLTA